MQEDATSSSSNCRASISYPDIPESLSDESLHRELSNDGDSSDWIEWSENEEEAELIQTLSSQQRETLAKLLMIAFFRSFQSRSPSAASNGSSSPGSTQNAGSSGGTAISKNSKKENLKRSPDDDENDNRTPTRRRFEYDGSRAGVRLLACPFCKNNPRNTSDATQPYFEISID